MIQIKHLEKKIEYNGTQLSPHWIYRNFDIQGDAIVSFIGPCKVNLTEMVDIADVKAEDSIYSPLMLNFIMEIFNENLTLMVHRQRLFIVAIKEELESRVSSKNNFGRIIRSGDDIYIVKPDNFKGKLSVSIATKSIVSTLMHTGINIKTEGTPVPTVGLEELGIEPVDFAKKIMKRFNDELTTIRDARCKVRGVAE
jgi:hypothetical protein